MLLQNDFKAKIKNIEDKIPDITNLATNTTFNVEINQVKNKIPNIKNLATTTTVLTTVENEKPDQNKYTLLELTAESFASRLAQEKFASKNDIDNFGKKKQTLIIK